MDAGARAGSTPAGGLTMTDAQKAEAFDLLARTFTNRWYDGRWSWFCHTPCGGPQRGTRAEAVADLVDYARRHAGHVEKMGQRHLTRIPLDVVG